MTKEETLRLALEALELVSIEFVCNGAHHSKKDRHEWLDPCPIVDRYKEAITAIKEALETKDEPFEYWNAVEGWVKLDEVREHFESVSCGTIYKNGGEGRVPLYTTPQRTWVGLTEEDEEFERIKRRIELEALPLINFTKQKEWVGLTAEEREQVQADSYGKVPHHVALIAAVEAKLKEKNI